ncbi:MAG: hypothetical protein ACFE9M_02965 [Promethearchaeota archaeon]
MVWGGSLNKKGSEHIRKLREADRVIAFLENFKKELKTEEKAYFSKTINIITEYITKMSDKED